MAAPVYATDLTTFWLEGATTVTAIGTGGAGLGNPETDFFIQGSGCISKAAWTNAIKGFIIDGLGANFTVPTDGAVIAFAKYDAVGSLDTKANGGLRFIIGSGSGDYQNYYCAGSNTIAFNSWVPYAIDPNTATTDATTGTPSGSERWVGLLASLPTTSGPTKGNPIAMDAIRYGRCRIDYTLGDSGTPATFAGAETFGNDATRRWGLLELQGGAYQTQGFHSIGTAGTACYFRDSNKAFYFRATGANNLSNNAVSNAFNRVEILNASSDVVWDNLLFQALGTRARGRFYHTAGAFTATNCQFVSTGLMSLLSSTVMTGCTFRSTGVITAPGSTLNGSKILTSRAETNLSALVWNVATDPTGLLDDMEFSKGTNAHHAIELGTSSPLTMTFNNPVSTGFNASDGQNDSFFHVKRTSGTVTINILGGTGNFSYRSDGATVNIVPNPITVTVTATLKDGTPVENARVYLRASNGTGPFPYLDSVTIARASTTATVTHTAHGLASNDKVAITGITDKVEDNGVHQITVTGVNTYTYTTTDSGSTSYTGTITSTFVALTGLTNASGVLTTSRVYSSAQPVVGWTRKSSGSPYLQEGVVVGSVSSTLGFSGTAVMLEDE